MEAIEQVRDALLEGAPVPAEALARLTPTERAEIAAMTATAVLARTALREQEAPSPEAEAASLHRARSVLGTQQPPRKGDTPRPGGGIAGWLARWLGRR